MTHLPHSKNILGYMPLHYSNSVKVTALNMFKKKKKKKLRLTLLLRVSLPSGHFFVFLASYFFFKLKPVA